MYVYIIALLQKQENLFSKFIKTDDTAHIPRDYGNFITYINEVFGERRASLSKVPQWLERAPEGEWPGCLM